MDFGIPESTAALLERFRRFVQDEVMPVERVVAERMSFRAALPEITALRARAKSLGLWLPQMPEDVGGMGLGFRAHSLVSEVLGLSPLGHFTVNAQPPDAGNMEILHKYGTDTQKRQWLEPLCRGDIRSCFSMTEPDRAGSNPTWLDTTAVLDGDHWVINGKKWFTTSADGARFAIVMAVTDPGAQEYGRASMIIVPTDAPGFELVRNIPVFGHAGDDYASHAEIVYRDVRVPKENLLGAQGGGFLIAQERLGPGRIHHCMRWIGICERSFDLMCKRAVEREIAPGRALGTRQIVQQWIAECRAEINAARLMVQHAAWKIDTVGLYESREEISCVKFFCSEVLNKVVDRAIQTHGAMGVTDLTPLSFFFHERAGRIYDGPDEVHKTMVASRILRRYGLGGASH
jgi:alkylation response protein AidB-like acyl-CoA dehydrogenase